MRQEGIEDQVFEATPVNPAKVPMVIKVSRKTLIAAIRQCGIPLPPNAVVTFRVPGGGDYSSTDVELDEKEQVVSVRYEV